MDSDKFLQTANESSARFVNYGVYFMLICCATSVISIIISLIYSFLKFGQANFEILYRGFKYV